MELRVIVIAVISLVIVSMSFLMQAHNQRGLQNSSAEVNLLDPAIPTNQNAGKTPSSNDFETAPTNDPWNEEPDDEGLDGTESGGGAFKIESPTDSEPLEPDLPVNRKGILPNESSSNDIPTSESTPLALDETSLPSVTSDESLIVAAESTEQLATVWESTRQSDGPIVEVTPETMEPLTNVAGHSFGNSEADDPRLAPAAQETETTEPAASEPTAQAAGNPVENNPGVDPGLAPAAQESEATTIASEQDVPPSVAQIARNHLQYGNSLARRGSLFSARQEFFSGLRLIIESLDLVNGVSTHRADYALAVTALNEAEDFVQSSGDEVSNSVPRIVELHQSKILTPADTQMLTPMAAMQAYFAFAQDRFSAACGHSPIASELLFSLGKLHTVKAAQDPTGEPTDLAIAILMHQAALNVDPANFLSANELGVALARLGHFEPARAALLHSVATRPTPEAWLNLSIVHRELGETQLSELALAEKKAAEASPQRETSLAQKIRWMAPAEFASAQQVRYEDTPSAPTATATKVPVEPITKPASNGLWTTFKRSLGGK